MKMEFARMFVLSALCVIPWVSQAVPSYSRQTGMDCSACHTAFPQLTPFGRQFKLQGYTLTNEQKAKAKGLQETTTPPLSAMIQASLSSLGHRQPDTQNNAVQFPSEFSLFYAGRISKNLGSFIQATYDGAEDHFGMDNTDIRWARQTKVGGRNVTYGLTLNNNPTVQDPWNSTPVWGFPFTDSGVAPTPAAATLVDGTLGQQVAGLGAYAMWNNLVYGEASFYRTSQLGSAPPDSNSENVIKGVAPYLRLAIEKNWGLHSIEMGAYGLTSHMYPNGVSGPVNKLHDVALDTQYQYIAGSHTMTVHGTWIYEKQEWDASFPAGNTSNSSDKLNTYKLDAIYYYKHKTGASIGYFATSGDADKLLYQPAPVDGSRTGNPDSSGAIIGVEFMPWLNTRVGLQYTAYNKFNGASSNYDGSGRDASDNNTLYLYSWLMF
jgi:hypothetical protein